MRTSAVHHARRGAPRRAPSHRRRRARGRRRGAHPDHADAVDRQRGLPQRHARGGQAHRREARPGPQGRPRPPARTSTPSATGRRAATRWAPGPRPSSSSRTPTTRRSRRGTRARPTGTWVETLFRGRHADGSWTKWYVLGRWTSGRDYAAGDIHRTSLDGQNDTDARILTDTFSTRSGREPVAFQTRVNLLRPVGASGSPRLDAVTTMTSELIPDYAGTSAFTLGRQVELAVPAYAQNIHSGEYPEYGGGGEVWCSPTSTAMVMRYFGSQHSPSAARPRRHRGAQRRPAGRPRRDERVGLHLRRRGQLAVQRGVRRDLRARRLRHPTAVAAGGRALRRGRHPGRHLAVVGPRGDAGGGVRHQRAPAGDHRVHRRG